MEISSNRRLGFTASDSLSNGEHVGFCQFSFIVSFAKQTPPFAYHVLCVVSLCALKQVSRVAAWRVVTAVQYTKGLQDFFTRDDFVSNDVCHSAFHAPARVSVSHVAFTREPRPAFVRLSDFNSLPKQIVCGFQAQMKRVDTQAILACLNEFAVFWNWAINSFVINAMSIDSSVDGFRRSAVSVRVDESLPNPTTRQRVNEVVSDGLTVAMCGEILSWLTFYASILAARMWRNCRLVAAPAMTISKGRLHGNIVSQCATEGEA